MKIRRNAKRFLLGAWSPLVPLWSRYKRRQLERDYLTRRERYRELARARHLVYSERSTREAVRKRLANRGHVPQMRALGEIHTFSFIPMIGWHQSLLPDLEQLGTLTNFDYTTGGYTVEEFIFPTSGSADRRRAMNEAAFLELQKAHERAPVDWVFMYVTGLEVHRNLVRRIKEQIGVPVVNMCLDDKHSWTGRGFGDQRAGQIDLAAEFDLSWTSARVACEWYLVEGGIPLYLAEGFDAARFQPRDVPQDVPVSFIGGAYGFRPEMIQKLERSGVAVQTWGPGWKRGPLSSEAQVEVLNRSRINLGMGGIGYSPTLTNLKGRDFEIPGTGGGVYLTSFNVDLAQHFQIGREILCYSTTEELIEQVRYYLDHPDEAEAISRSGRARCVREHRWLHRYMKVLEVLGILQQDKARA